MLPSKSIPNYIELQADILRLQRFKTWSNPALDVGLDCMKDAFPQGSFPLGCIHEFLSTCPEEATATGGFISGLLTALMGEQGTVLWISAGRKIFPPGLKNFGLLPDHFVFVDLQREKDVIWALDEALKCSALAAVVGEVRDLSFTASRRLQLAVEQSQATGFILRHHSNNPGTTACISRWKITSLPSEPIEALPGIGFPKWRVELLRMRNGKPGVWNFQWVQNRFVLASPPVADALPEMYYKQNAS